MNFPSEMVNAYLNSDPNVLGEFLRYSTFTKDGGIGGYSNLRFEKGWVAESVYSNSYKSFIKTFKLEEVENTKIYYNGILNLFCCNYSDGDSVLIFWFPEGSFYIVNYDCKKVTNWKWLS